MKSRKTLAIFNLLALLVVLAVNGMASAGMLNDRTTEVLSDKYPNLFVPAGFTFAIWGLIFVALLAFVLYQFSNVLRAGEHQDSVVEPIGFDFILSCVANAGWLVAWHYEFVWLSVLIMIVLLLSLVRIYRNLEIGLHEERLSIRWLVHAPFSLYLGWISIAMIANVTVFLTTIDWNGFGIDPAFWTLLMFWAAVTITYRVLRSRRDYIFAFVIIWAFYGIYVKRSAESGQGDVVAIGALAGIALIVIMAFMEWRRRRLATAIAQ